VIYKSSHLLPRPLAARMRPKKLEDFVGQEHLLRKGKLLYRLIQSDHITSLIFFGPPGTGKTTLAGIIASTTQAHFEKVNAVSSSVKEIRHYIEKARERLECESRRTILFIDELHRFNKAQQDILMPVVEEGDLCLIGATVHNPAFSIISPLLSRSHAFEFKRLSNENLFTVLNRAICDCQEGFGKYPVKVTEEALHYIVRLCDGDARRALNILEVGFLSSSPDEEGRITIDQKIAMESSQRKIPLYDKNEDGHYDTISAFIKSMRGSDPDAAIYWLAKMIEAGEDPLFIARRILIFASEDVGNADPHALMVGISVFHAVEVLGLPEARISLAQAVSYLACAPKSNASYIALENALKDVQHQPTCTIPEHLKNVPSVDKSSGKREAYQYAHHYPGAYVVQEYCPQDKIYYHPTERGYEKNIKARLELWRKKKFEKKS